MRMVIAGVVLVLSGCAGLSAVTPDPPIPNRIAMDPAKPQSLSISASTRAGRVEEDEPRLEELQSDRQVLNYLVHSVQLPEFSALENWLIRWAREMQVFSEVRVGYADTDLRLESEFELLLSPPNPWAMVASLGLYPADSYTLIEAGSSIRNRRGEVLVERADKARIDVAIWGFAAFDNLATKSVQQAYRRFVIHHATTMVNDLLMQEGL